MTTVIRRRSEKSESSIKSEIKRYLESKGAYWSMVAGGTYSKTGDPDIIACYKGHFVAIEAKTSIGKQRELQMVREKEIKNAGGIYLLARSVDDVRGCLEVIDNVAVG